MLGGGCVLIIQAAGGVGVLHWRFGLIYFGFYGFWIAGRRIPHRAFLERIHFAYERTKRCYFANLLLLYAVVT